MHLFALATLLPAACLCLGSVLGGAWAWAGLLMITAGCFLVDRLARGDAVRSVPSAEFPAGDRLSVGLALLHLPMLGLSVWAISSSDSHSVSERIVLLIGFGLFFGQIGHPNAHELIHRSNRWLRRLGVMVYATLLIGHHVSAHRLVHHVHVATPQDPNTATQGKGFWRFLIRAWPRTLLAGLRAEHTLRRRTSGTAPILHPYCVYLFWAMGGLFLSYLAFGKSGLWTFIFLASYAQIQIFLADYVQHYGLQRARNEEGKPEPVGPGHAWNSPHLGSSAMMLNAPRHSDHHLHPTRHYPALQLGPEMPVLPYSLPVMAVVALIPPWWRKLMDPRVDQRKKGG